MLSATSYRLIRILLTTKQILFILLVIGTVCSCKEPKPPQVTFDIPALIGKNIDEVRKVLGKPYSPIVNRIEPSDPKEEYFSNDYDKNGVYISFYFNTKSRRISQITLISPEEYDKLEDVMKIGNLTSKETDSYWVESFHPFAGTPPFNGIKIHVR